MLASRVYMETRVSVEHFRWGASSAFHGTHVSRTFVSNKWEWMVWGGGEVHRRIRETMLLHTLRNREIVTNLEPILRDGECCKNGLI